MSKNQQGKKKNTRRKVDKPRWTEMNRLRNELAQIERDDPERKNEDLQKKREAISLELAILNGIW